jgi:hypothetical protein
MKFSKHILILERWTCVICQYNKRIWFFLCLSFVSAITVQGIELGACDVGTRCRVTGIDHAKNNENWSKERSSGFGLLTAIVVNESHFVYVVCIVVVFCVCVWGARCIGGWVGPRAGLDECGKSRLHRHSITLLSSPYRLQYHGLCIYIYIYSKTCLKRTPYIPETWTNEQ